MQPPGSVTQLLIKWSSGDQAALDQLIPMVYRTLRRLATAYMRREREGQSLQATALVHEAYVRLVDQKSATWENRTQFFGMAAKLMRNILVDHARERKAFKRGGGQYRMSLADLDRIGSRTDVEVLALNDALNELAEAKPKHARIVELRFFGGLTVEETAQVLGISRATVERDWTFARAWLRTAMQR
ncbi:MAG TPA: sigma-70 family RNA polymerase sigma factor [Blastocatellia bacterium]|nr:sigma-70 family RNA polymerase sigma factor [Blastocatellia bacterium]